MSAERSNNMFNNVADILKNHGFDIEMAQGLIWNKFTNAQARFINFYDVNKVTYELPLFPGQTKYEIDDWVSRITYIGVNREGFNPDITLPEVSMGDHRYVTVNEPEIPCEERTIQEGDILELECFIDCPDGVVIDVETDPIIPKKYDMFLEEWVLADYGNDKLRVRNKQDIAADVKALVQKGLSLNRVQCVKINILKFG